MAFLDTPLSTYARNKNWLLTGAEEDRPETGGPLTLDRPETGGPLTVDPGAYPGLQRRQAATPRTPQAFSRSAQSASPTPRAPNQTQTQTTTIAPSSSLAPQAGPSPREPGPAPTLPSYQRTGTLSERLYSPVTRGAQAGQESLTGAAELFRQEAGPSRTYESTGAEGTLRTAYQTGAPGAMEAARGFVGAKYAGPQGLDQQTTAGLQKLTEDLQARQRALGSAGGLQTLIGQSVAGLTPGEALFEAKRRLPEAKIQGRDLGFQQVNPLVSRLLEERRGAEAFAKQRTGEEADIAARSRGFLTGERGGISSAIEALMAERAAQQQAAAEAFAGVGGEGGLEAAAPFLRSGTMEAPGTLTGAEAAAGFRTPGVKGLEQANAAFQTIMADPRFAGIAQYDPLELGISGRGKGFYDIGGEDVRGVVDDPAVRRLLYERQQELEKAFDPARGQARAFSRTPTEGGELAQFRPLYYGDEFKPADIQNYLGFDPGVRPSRENTSSEVQRQQFNNINDLLGELDRISAAGEPFRAAQIFADTEKYLADEEAALEARKGELSEQNEAWRKQVKTLRKAYRKAAREKEYAKIGGIVGGVLGLGIGQGDPATGSFGAQLGQSAGKSLA